MCDREEVAKATVVEMMAADEEQVGAQKYEAKKDKKEKQYRCAPKHHCSLRDP